MQVALDLASLVTGNHDGLPIRKWTTMNGVIASSIVVETEFIAAEI